MKRQIHAAKGHGAIAVEGHDLKLGRGGIREIEFFVQTQQLIAGGRNPALRGRRTLDMLAALAGERWITAAAAAELRRPICSCAGSSTACRWSPTSRPMSCPTTTRLWTAWRASAALPIRAHLRRRARSTFETVQRHYAALFEEARGSRPRPAASSSPAPAMIQRPSRPWRRWASASPASCRRRCAAGISDAIRPPARRGPASFSPS